MIHISGCGKPGGAEWTVKLVIISRWEDKLSTLGACRGGSGRRVGVFTTCGGFFWGVGVRRKKGAGPTIGDVGTDFHLRRHGVCIHRRGNFVIQGQTRHGSGWKMGWY